MTRVCAIRRKPLSFLQRTTPHSLALDCNWFAELYHVAIIRVSRRRKDNNPHRSLGSCNERRVVPNITLEAYPPSGGEAEDPELAGVRRGIAGRAHIEDDFFAKPADDFLRPGMDFVVTCKTWGRLSKG